MSDPSAFELSKGLPPDTIRSRGNYRRSGHGFTTGQVVFYDASTLEWGLSDWLYYNLTGSAEALGVIDAIDTYKFDVVYRGSVVLPNSMMVTGPSETIQPGTVYFLSDSPGFLTETPPVVDKADPKVRKPILVTLDDRGDETINALVVNYRGYVEETDGCVAFIQNIIPVGTIEIMPGGIASSNNLDGWLLCDGTRYNIADYPDLYTTIGNAYSIVGQSVADGKFTVPDFTTQASRIMLGTNSGVHEIGQDLAYGGTDDLTISLSEGATVAEHITGPGYASFNENLNKQATYHTNFYIRYKNIERYVNIETCNGAGGAIRNWMVNGSLDIWQRGNAFSPDVSLTGTDHLADLNRYTADKWFRKVGYCPTGMGADDGQSYIGVCNKHSFSSIDVGVPDALRIQYPTHYMEYQSYITGPGTDTSLEYCALEHRISDVKSLAGKQVCVSFWARSNNIGTVYVNLKQHFGYDIPYGLRSMIQLGGDAVPTYNTETEHNAYNPPIENRNGAGYGSPSYASPYIQYSPESVPTEDVESNTDFPVNNSVHMDRSVLADSTNAGGSFVLSDPAISIPNQETTIITKAIVTTIPNAFASQKSLQIIGNDPVVVDPDNVTVEGFGSNAIDVISDDGSINTTPNPSILIDVEYTCSATPYCNQCTPVVTKIIVLGELNIYTANANECETTSNGVGDIAISMGESSRTVQMSLSISPALYALVVNFDQSMDVSVFPQEVVAAAILFATTKATENPDACKCATRITIGNTEEAQSCYGFTVDKNYDATLDSGICCIVDLVVIKRESHGEPIVKYTRIENQTVHSCESMNGQFISYDAVDYFNQFEDMHCGVSEDYCSDYAAIHVTYEWQQYEITFIVPDVNNRYIGNSGTDYLAFQLWTHLHNGYCSTFSGVEAPPRNRLGGDFGSQICSNNSLCEPCVSSFPFPFSYEGTLNLAQFQLQTGSEFTGYVKPNLIELMDTCQGTYESNTCATKGEYYPIEGANYFEYEVYLKRQKICPTPRSIISAFNTSPSRIGNIDIATESVTQKGFVIKGDVLTTGAGKLAITYECDCDLYRAEELPYLMIQLELRKAAES